MKLLFRPVCVVLVIMLVVVAGLYSLGINKGIFAQTTGGGSTGFGTETACVVSIVNQPYPLTEPKYPQWPWNTQTRKIVSPFYNYFVDNLGDGVGTDTSTTNFFIGLEKDIVGLLDETGTQTYCIPTTLVGTTSNNNDPSSVDIGEFKIVEDDGNCPPGYIWTDYNENGVKDAGECWLGMTVKSGNVGVGTDTPLEKLDVNGNVKADSFIGDGSQLTGISGGGTPPEVIQQMQEQILLMQGQIQALLDEVQILRECCDDGSSSGHKKKKKKKHHGSDDGSSGNQSRGYGSINKKKE